jgi:hypothetical protein
MPLGVRFSMLDDLSSTTIMFGALQTGWAAAGADAAAEAAATTAPRAKV